MAVKAFDDLVDSEGILPTFGLRLLVGLDADGEDRVIVEKCGSIDSARLIGILETLQVRLMLSKGV